MPACTVVIPWHRNIDDLRRAGASVFAQTVQDFEIVVVANGVDDDACTAAAALFSDPRWRVARLETAGASIARNHGIILAEGELIFFLDADDVFFGNKLERFFEAHRAAPFDVAFSRGIRQRGNGVSWAFPVEEWDGVKPVSEFFFCDGCTISASAIVMATAARDRVYFSEKCGSYEDPDLIIRAEAMGMRVTMLPDALYEWSDERVGDRLSQLPNHTERLAWIDRIGDAATAKARAAYRARCVAQHVFPRDFTRNIGIFVDAMRLGATTPRETALFMLRGFLPSSLQRSLLNLYFRMKARA